MFWLCILALFTIFSWTEEHQANRSASWSDKMSPLRVKKLPKWNEKYPTGKHWDPCSDFYQKKDGWPPGQMPPCLSCPSIALSCTCIQKYNFCAFSRSIARLASVLIVSCLPADKAGQYLFQWGKSMGKIIQANNCHFLSVVILLVLS